LLIFELLGSKAKLGIATSGLTTGLIFGSRSPAQGRPKGGRTNFNLSVKPLFKEALILISSCKPSIVRCFLSFMIPKAFLNNKKSAYFCVISGYNLKWSTIKTKSPNLVLRIET